MDNLEEEVVTARHLGFALDSLIRGHGWKAKQLAARAAVTPSTISAYTRGEGLDRERLEELARLMDLGPEDVERAIIGARLVLPRLPGSRTPVDPTPEERRIDEKAAAMAGCELMDLILAIRLREHWQENARRDLEEGRRLAQELMAYPPAERRFWVAGAPDDQHWGLAFVLSKDSEAAAPRKPENALELAELALFVAQHVQDSGAFKPRLEGWCTGFVGNAQRVLGRNLPEAVTTFARTWRRWKQGEDPAGLLSEAYLLDMEASLRGDLRQFNDANRLHDEALSKARPGERGAFLLNKACTHQKKGEHEEALQTLEKAAQEIDGERQPRLTFGVQFNRASNLLLLDQAAEAAPIVVEVRKLAERLRNDSDLVRTLWLEGNLAAGFGRKEEALTKLEQVRHEFDVRGNPFDYALASLDVALLYREEGRFPEIKILADGILDIFESQKVHREAIAAAMLFQDAARNETATAEMVRRLKDYLAAARSNRQLHFEG